MEIKTKEGIGEPMPLTDIQQNNKLIKAVIVVFGIPLIIITTIILWLIWYIIKNNVIGNILRVCG